jgi:Creatinase/Prolidase N-terminal domain
MLPPMPHRPRVHELRVPNLSDVDFGKLRAGRLARLQTMLKRHDFPVALLYGTANIRYATGVDVMAVWTAGTLARYCLVPAEGAPILFEYKGSVHVSQRIVADVRPAYTWQYGGVAARDKAREWARSLRAALRERGLERERLAVDKLDTVGFLALQEEGIEIVDVGPATVDAREVKTPDAGHQHGRAPHLHVSVRHQAARLMKVIGACCLALALGACASANTPQQNLAYERWARCQSPFVQLERIDLDGRISFMVSNASGREETFQCLAEAGRTGPPLPGPRAVWPPGGP